MSNPSTIRGLAASVALVALTGAAAAAPAIGLSGDKTLVWFDTDKPEISKTVEIDGVEMLQGIDLRPSNNMLYGVTRDGTIVTIDMETGAATAGSKLATNLPEGVTASVDFNPMADRLRLMGSDGTNLRANVDTGEVTEDGKLAFEAGDANAESEPKVIATAYINSYGKPEKTAMYDVDAAGTFIQQVKPNDGVLKTIGSLGIGDVEMVAMDVQTTADGTNTAWLAAGGALYTIDVATGTATKTGDITGAPGMLRDIAILPAM
ncbi:DUF4394 domain-containing protein [Aquibium sp. ELW1220]|uniref:DUF4394 domain-containing protein n=1 Tax=Aquibium sp. ELW1220 TaxID=2976766 RepID=UPI0025AFC4FD|nr:DUF4394 domain-containing protein [Aquibium sp. ELW1220]MDN2579265.1 DUF4394 domain-containing protein [Aquibium sp. ELW1220]